ncbi:MAG: prolyl oligopeptidase family serine peptidase, partial [Caulobacteraceae bacterium]
VYFAAPAEAPSKAQQIWRLPLDGGEAEQVTSLEQGVGVFALSPDGKEIAFSALAAAPKPPGAHDPIRISRIAWRFDPVAGYLHERDQAVHLVAARGGKARAITPFGGVIQTLAFSPSGQEIAAVVLGRAEREYVAFLGDLAVIDRRGEARTLLTKTAISGLCWTPDGAAIAYSALAADGEFSRQPALFAIDAAGGAPRRMSDQSLGAVGGAIQSGSPGGAARSRLAPAPDGGGIIAAVTQGGATGIFEIAVKGRPKARRLVEGERTCKVLCGQGTSLLFASEDFTTPSELWALDLASGEARALTRHNEAWRKAVAWPKVERVTAASAPGVEIEGWVLLPASGKAPFKTILFIHGGPHAGWGCSFNEDFLEMAGSGWAAAFCNPRGSTGYGDDFSGAIVGRWGDPELEDFEAFLDELVRRGLADPDRLGVTGVSGGGHLSAWLIGHTDRFKAAVPEQGVYNMLSMYGVSDAGVELLTHELGGAPHEAPGTYWERSPIAHAHKCTTPALLIQGENDVRCPMEQAEQLYTVLRRNGCQAELLRLRNCNHGLQVWGPPPLRRARMDAMKDWFGRHIR